MRIRRLIPILVVLIVLALTIMTASKQSPIAVESGTATAQKDVAVDAEPEPEPEPTEADGVSTFPATETKEERDYDLYLDKAEVERLAAEEQRGDGTITSTSRVPLSFKHLALPLGGGLDYAVAGVATRNSGNGVIRLRGVPPGSTLVGAVLIWGEITNQPVGYQIGFSPVCSPAGGVFQGTVYGITQQPCWNPNGVYAGYIANVTPQVGGGINGDYQVKGLRSAIANNRCPWTDAACGGPGNGLVLSEGASLIVFYTNPCIPANAQVYVHLGPQMFSGSHSVTHFTAGFPILPNMQTVKHSRIGADGQVSLSSGSLFPAANPSCGLRSHPLISDERTWIVNSLGAQIQIKGDGAGLNRDSDWNGYDGEPLNKLWDTHTDVFSNSNFLAAGGGLFYTVRYQSQGDCIVWAAHILGIR